MQTPAPQDTAATLLAAAAELEAHGNFAAAKILKAATISKNEPPSEEVTTLLRQAADAEAGANPSLARAKKAAALRALSRS